VEIAIDDLGGGWTSHAPDAVFGGLGLFEVEEIAEELIGWFHFIGVGLLAISV
jgi:hypothetical protein